MSARDILIASGASATTGDPNWSNVSLLLSGDSTDVDANWGSVSFMLSGSDLVDYSNNHNAVTVNGSMSVNTTTKKYGTGSLFHAAGSTNYLSIPGDCINFGTGDFTIEFWGYTTNVGAESLGMAGTVTASSFMLMCGGNGSGRISFGVTSSSWNLNSVNGAIVVNSWNHIAVSRNSSTAKLFINGTQVDSQTLSTNFVNATAFEIGRRETSYGATYDCYYSDIRITKGVGRYTAAFTPPTASLPILKVTDTSPNAYSVTAYGNSQFSTSIKKYGSSSISFDGAGDRLVIPTSSAFAFSTGNFTIECWVYPTSSQTVDAFWVSASGSGGLFFGTNAGGIGWGRAGVAWDYNSGVLLTTSVWSHIALVRYGTSMTIYVNGSVAGASQTNGTSYDVSTTSLNIGSQGAGYYYTGYMDEVRITKGVARYTSNFTPPTTAFLASSDTVVSPTPATPAAGTVILLLSETTISDSTLTVTDSSPSPKTVSTHGGYTSSAPVKFGTGALGLSPSTGLTVPSSVFSGLGTSVDFTIEFWVYLQSRSMYSTVCGQWGSTTKFNIMLENSSSIGIQYMYTGNATFASGPTSSSIPVQQWTHVAFSRSGSTCKCFINGVGTTLSSNPNIDANDVVGVGNVSNQFSYGIDGYIDDFRVTRSVARYTSNFTPPTSAFTSTDTYWSNVSLLLNFNTLSRAYTFLDSSTSPNTISPVGDVWAGGNPAKFGSTNLMFNGTGGRLACGPNSNFAFGTNNFTIECWVYRASDADSMIVSFGNSSAYPCIVSTSSSVRFCQTGTGSVVATTTSGLTLNSWVHLAVVRLAGTTTIYINGVASGSGTDSNNWSGSYVDVGSNTRYDTSWNFSGAIDDFRITNGAVYNANFTPPTSAATTSVTVYTTAGSSGSGTSTTIDANTKLLLTGDGTNGSQSFTDLSNTPNTITVTGNTQVNTTTKKYGTGSIYFDGSGDYLGVTTIALSGDYTVEAWLYRTAAISSYMMVTGYDTTSSWIGWISNSTSFLVGSTSGYKTFTVPETINQWSHYAVVRSGSTVHVYVDGVESSTGGQTLSTDLDINLIGAYGTSYTFTGYMDDLRVSSTARYTSNFTPPTSMSSTGASTAWSNVKLLLNGDGTNGSTTFTDLSSSPNTLTTNGGAQISTSQKKFGTGSMYFDGAGDYLTMPTTTGLIFDGDFTIECWAYRVAASAGYDALYTTNALQAWDANGNATALVWSCGGFHGFGKPWTTYSSGTSLTTGAWTHMAVTKASGTVCFYIGGTQVHTLTHSGNIGYSGQTQGIAVFDSYSGPGGRLFFNGYIDDFRITKGVAVYTGASYTPPTAALPTS